MQSLFSSNIDEFTPSAQFTSYSIVHISTLLQSDSDADQNKWPERFYVGDLDKVSQLYTFIWERFVRRFICFPSPLVTKQYAKHLAIHTATFLLLNGIDPFSLDKNIKHSKSRTIAWIGNQSITAHCAYLFTPSAV